MMRSSRIFIFLCILWEVSGANPSIHYLALFDTNLQREVRQLASVDYIDLVVNPTGSFSITANATVDTNSVEFGWGSGNKHTESSPRLYSLTTQGGSGVHSWNVGIGFNNISATPFANSGGTGKSGALVAVNITIFNSTSTGNIPTTAPTTGNPLAQLSGSSSLTAFLPGSNSASTSNHVVAIVVPLVLGSLLLVAGIIATIIIVRKRKHQVVDLSKNRKTEEPAIALKVKELPVIAPKVKELPAIAPKVNEPAVQETTTPKVKPKIPPKVIVLKEI